MALDHLPYLLSASDPRQVLWAYAQVGGNMVLGGTLEYTGLLLHQSMVAFFGALGGKGFGTVVKSHKTQLGDFAHESLQGMRCFAKRINVLVVPHPEQAGLHGFHI